MRYKRRSFLGFMVAGGAAVVTSPAALLAAPQHRQPINLLPIRINSITPVTDPVTGVVSLVANGVIGAAGNTFTTPLSLSALPNAADPATPILHLQVGAIHLDLLGLVVDTSPICLQIDAIPGPGNLLGNLLSAVANLLNNGLSLGAILTQLGASLATFLNGLTALLNGALSQATTVNQAGANPQVTVSGTSILNLSLGPVHLNLLGLDVLLDNCSNGPVVVSITAVPGPGNLLGNLLAGLAGLLNTPANVNAIQNALQRIAAEIQRLVALV